MKLGWKERQRITPSLTQLMRVSLLFLLERIKVTVNHLLMKIFLDFCDTINAMIEV